MTLEKIVAKDNRYKNASFTKESFDKAWHLINEFYNELKLYGHKFKTNKSKLISYFQATKDLILSLNYESIGIDLSSGKHLKYIIYFEDDRTLMLTNLDFEDEEYISSIIIYSFFIKNHFIVTNVAEIDEFVKNFNKYLDEHNTINQ